MNCDTYGEMEAPVSFMVKLFCTLKHKMQTRVSLNAMYPASLHSQFTSPPLRLADSNRYSAANPSPITSTPWW